MGEIFLFLVTSAWSVSNQFTFTDIIIKNELNSAFCSDSEMGGPCKMTYLDAKAYCALNHSSLPTVRDFAEWSVSHGAKGILSTTPLSKKDIPSGYYEVGSVYEDESTDVFYFSHDGFKKPIQGPPDDSYWTLSTAIQNKDYAHVFYSAFGGGGGDPEEHKKTYKNSVICLQKL